MTIDRRRLLVSGGGLAGSLLVPGAFAGRALGQDRDDDDDDTGRDAGFEEEDDPGLDLDGDDNMEVGTRVWRYARPDLPPRFVVDPSFLPPVGDQGRSGTCVAWAVGYGLTTYMLARRYGTDPRRRSSQVSAAYLYGTVVNAKAAGCGDARDDALVCGGDTSDRLPRGGTKPAAALAILRHWGSVSAEQCPYPRVRVAGIKVAKSALYDNIFAAWGRTRAHPSLKILRGHKHTLDLTELKRTLAEGEPLVYTFNVPKGFKKLDVAGEQPWEGRDDPGGGHAVLLIGYDDRKMSAGGSRGAFLIQNSWGKGWGMSWPGAFRAQYPNAAHRSGKGYVWITYDTFLALGKWAFSMEV